MSSVQQLSISQLLISAIDQLESAGIEDPLADAQLLIGSVLGVSRGRVQALSILQETVTPEQATALQELVDERARRVPLQHLTGKAPFRTLELEVGPGVFVPRPETEVVTQFAIDELVSDAQATPLALDLCTGSGAIALSIAAEVPQAQVWAVEKDPLAAAWAQRNIEALGDGRVTLVTGDILDPHPSIAHLKGNLTVLVTNPPYVPENAIPRDPEVREHDPQAALYSGADGLDLIRNISAQYQGWVRPGGLIVIEHAESQGAAIRDILLRDGWESPATHRDLTFRDRCTTARAATQSS